MCKRRQFICYFSCRRAKGICRQRKREQGKGKRNSDEMWYQHLWHMWLQISQICSWDSDTQIVASQWINWKAFQLQRTSRIHFSFFSFSFPFKPKKRVIPSYILFIVFVQCTMTIFKTCDKLYSYLLETIFFSVALRLFFLFLFRFCAQQIVDGWIPIEMSYKINGFLNELNNK